MENDTASTNQHDCIRIESGKFIIALAMVSFPIQILLIKVLFWKSRLTLPRHMILASLTISDFIQVNFGALIIASGRIFDPKTKSWSCQLHRKLMEISCVVTVVTASGSILALCLERYIACVHCFRVHQIFSEQRVKRLLYTIWISGIIAGFVDYKRYIPNYTLVLLPLTSTFSIIYFISVLPTSVILLILQTRLYLLSMRKLKVEPANNFGAQAEAKDLIRRQLKLAICASFVAILYIVCMCPLAFYIMHTGFKEVNDASAFRSGSIFIAAINTLVDPFLYGIGMADTRREMKRELKSLNNYIFCKD
eukprot:gene10184-11230_t